MNIIQFLENPDLMGESYGGASWEAMKSVLCGAFAVPMADDRLKLFNKLAGGRVAPAAAVKELYIIASRRSGKSDTIGATAVYLATVGVMLTNTLDRLSVGERAYISIIAPDRDQAGLLIGYIKGKMNESAVLSAMIDRETTDGLDLNNRVSIRVNTASFRAVRGKSNLAVIFDEACFLRSENAANPDEEIYRAALPSLATLGGMVIAISSPYSKKGLMYRKYQKHFGKDSERVLVVQGGTPDFNPTIDPQIIADALADDPESASAEWLGQWREGLSDYIERDLIDSLTRSKPLVLPYDNRNHYVAFADPSGGGRDQYTLAIGHLDKASGKLIVDLLCGERGQPAEITARYAELIKQYKCYAVMSDRYAGSWPKDEFSKHRVKLEHSELSRSELYQFALPMLRTERVELPRDQQMVNEFANLERRTSRAGRDVIDHPVGGAFHDDKANVVAGLIYLANKLVPLASGVRFGR
jgi:hypothetical protein